MYTKVYSLESSLKANSHDFAKVLQYDPKKDKIVRIDLSESNTDLDQVDFRDTVALAAYIDNYIKKVKAKFVFGGYNEFRSLYSRSDVFSGPFASGEPRRLHLGTDIWAAAGTSVHAPLGGMVHSFAYNNQFGDYGGTIILQHQLDTQSFHTLYGHLSLNSLNGLREGQYFSRGQKIAELGIPEENGMWPPHLHFQLIKDMELKEGDYPGVCRYSQRQHYLNNCPDPDLILGYEV